MDVSANGTQQCLPFRGAVAPRLHKPGEAGDPETRFMAVLGALVGIALPFALFAAHKRLRRARPAAAHGAVELTAPPASRAEL